MNRNFTLLAVTLLVVGLGAAYMLAQGPVPEAPAGDVFAQGPMGGPGNGGPGGQGGPGAQGGPGGGPGGMGNEAFPHERMGNMIQMIGHMGEAMFNPRIAGVIAIGGLKDEVGKKPAEKIKFFEVQLETTKTLGLRNAIRLTLKDLYKATGDDDKAVGQLKTMLEENDAAIQQEKAAK